jgi:hypothetical protein
MVKYRKILFILLFAGISLSASSANAEFPSSVFPIVDGQQDKTMFLEVMINGTSKIIMENVPTTGYLEVYSILGVRVMNVNLKTCVGGCYIDLPKGLYILKAGKVAQKVIVR